MTEPSTGAASVLAAAHPDLRERFQQSRRELLSMLQQPGAAGVGLARRHAEIADGLVTSLFTAVVPGGAHRRLLLGAVGGYGRRLLGLASDLDLCFVTADEPDRTAHLVESVMYPLWDAGIDVGHQLVRVSDVVADAQGDLPMATELLDFRPIVGNVNFAHAVRRAIQEQLFSEEGIVRFIEQLETQSKARYARFGDTVYLLEPDVKNGMGGLRDLDLALWAARARFGESDLAQLANHGVFTRRRLSETAQAVDFLWSVRNHLHRHAGRKADRLTFAAQEAVARDLGYDRGLDPSRSDLERTGQMVESFMSDYYRHARVISRARDLLIGRAKRRASGEHPVTKSLGDGFIECAGRVGLEDLASLEKDPAIALRLYQRALARDAQVLSRTRDAIATATADPEFAERLRASPEASHIFVKLACTCRAAPWPSILGELHDVGILLALIPEFAPVVGRVHHDLYHVYTVDVHSLAAVDRLRELTRGELTEKLPIACRLAAEVVRPQVLFLGTLLHDVGKAIGGKNHAARGARMAREILGRMGLQEDDIDDACHLIQEHLTMYMVAARRDLGDPATVQEFVRGVRGLEGLRDLYLLTVADLSTTSATAMTRWKASMLTGLYRASEAYLSGNESAPSARIERVRARVLDGWQDPDTREELLDYLQSMPRRYFLANTADEILAHARLAITPGASTVGVSQVPAAHDGVMGVCVVTRGRTDTGLCVVTGDRPGLLASISAAIQGADLLVESAQVHTRSMKDGDMQAVDVFWVRAESDAPLLREKLEKLERDLGIIVDGKAPAASFVKQPPPPPSWARTVLPAVRTEVLIDHHGSADHTILEILTEDRPALLYTLAEALHGLGLSISVAKISTEGRRAIDVFYANEIDGSKLEPGERTDQVRRTVLAALEA